MKNYGFKIKISDLLQNPGKSDVLELKNRKTRLLKNLGKQGINGNILIQSLNKDSIYVNIKQLNCDLIVNCDFCGIEYEKSIIVKNYNSKFVRYEIHHNIGEKIHDEEFLIDDDENIDLEDLIVQSILLNKEIVDKCKKCIKKTDIINDKIDNNDIPSSTKSNIKWIK